jgi:hypothetical protein
MPRGRQILPLAATTPVRASAPLTSPMLVMMLRRLMASLRPTRRRLALVGLSVLVLMALAAILPEPAFAWNPVDSAVRRIFGVRGDWLSGTFVQWLIQINSPGLSSNGAGASLYIATRDFAFAALSAVLTLSVIHYWAAGLFSQGGGAGVAIEGLVRTIGAALFILAWPFIIDSGVGLSAIIRDELIPGAKLDAINATLFSAAVFSPGLVVGIIIVSAYAVIALALYITKVMLSVGLLTLAGMMPLAMVLWAIPALAWFANAMLKACAAIIAVQVAWAGEVFLFAQIPGNWLTFSGQGHVLSKLAAPITMVALLFLMLLTAPWVMRLAGMGAGNFLSFMSSQLAVGGVHQGWTKAKPVRDVVKGGRFDRAAWASLRASRALTKGGEGPGRGAAQPGRGSDNGGSSEGASAGQSGQSSSGTPATPGQPGQNGGSQTPAGTPASGQRPGQPSHGQPTAPSSGAPATGQPSQAPQTTPASPGAPTQGQGAPQGQPQPGQRPGGPSSSNSDDALGQDALRDDVLNWHPQPPPTEGGDGQ